VTRGWLPQRAVSPSLNGGGAAAAVPPFAPAGCNGLTENDGHENDGPSKLQDVKLQDMKMQDKNAVFITLQ